MAATFLWYDLETFGVHPGWDRIAQFAAQRTDERFEPIGESVVLYCRISPDYLPSPEACLITGITPRTCGEHGVVEAEFATLLREHLTVPATCLAGFNTIRFDGEFLRNLFYRNFHDPYAHEHANRNSRWDLMDLARMMHDLRPEGVNWVAHADGRPNFQLQALCAANGIGSERAHDAASDVRSTVELARLFHTAQPRTFTYYFGLRKKETARRLLNLQNPQPVVLSAAALTRPGACSSVVYPVAVDPVNQHKIICFDLRDDPATLIAASVEEIRRRLFTSKEELGAGERLSLVEVHLNRCPAIAPLNTLSPERAGVLGIDLSLCDRHRRELSAHPELVQAVREAYAAPPFRQYGDPDLNIYAGGFFGDADRETFRRIHSATPGDLQTNPPQFQDPRGYQMLRNYLGRNFSDQLNPTERRAWRSSCARRLLSPEYEHALDHRSYMKRVRALIGAPETAPGNLQILKDLLDYGVWLERHVLSAETHADS